MAGLHHLALGARDVGRVAAFYRDVLGLEEVTRHHRPDGSLRSVWLVLDGGAVLMVEQRELAAEPAREAGLFLLALRIDERDRDRWETRLAEAGAAIERRSAATSYARDPEGNAIAVSFHALDSSRHGD